MNKIKIKLMILSAFVSAIFTAASFAAGDDPLLEEILSLAASNNPAIKAAAERVNQAKAGVREAAARMGPSLSAELSGTLGNETPNQAREAYAASLNLVQAVYAGNTPSAERNAAKLALSAVEAESARTYQDVMNSVRINYHNTLRAAAHLNVAEESLNMAQEHLNQTESLFKAGIAPRGDVLRVKVSVSGAEQSRISAGSELEISLTALERAAGANLPRDGISLRIRTVDIESISPPKYEIPDDPVKKALEKRPEILAYEFYGKRAEELIRAAKGERMPAITFSGGFQVSGNNYYTDDDEWYARLALQWTLYDGGSVKARIDRQKAAARELLYEMEDLKSGITREAAEAKTRLESSIARYEVALGQVADSKEDYRLALRRYDAQVGTNLDVLDSRSALTDSLTAYVNAVYDIAAAQSELIYATGEDGG